MGIQYIPPYLLVADKEDEVILLLKGLPIPDRRKKQILIEWTKVVGAALTREMVEKLLGEGALGV